MKSYTLLGVFAAALVATGALAGDTLKSGPQVGHTIPGPFHPLNVTGSEAGKRADLVELNGANPVALIFAREVTAPLTRLVKKIDAATINNKPRRMGSFVVFLSDDERLDDRLKALARTEGIKKCVLSIDNPAGPRPYRIAKDAEVTVILYTRRNVKGNFAFKKGELNEQGIERVLAAVSRIIPDE
jgi:hypothetical protein